MLTREAILAADDLPRELVQVPEWGGEVFVRTITGAERDRFEAALLGNSKSKNPQDRIRNVRARLAVLCCCDDAGQRLFRDEDAEALGAKSAAALDRVFAVGSRLNRLSKRDEEQLAETEELAKN